MSNGVLLEVKILIGAIIFSIAAPFLDLILRFLIPIISGITWIFLKPYVLFLKEKYGGFSFKVWIKSLINRNK